MKEQTSVVNPAVGTLKQTISKTGAMIRKASLRMFAFIFLISMSLPNMAFVQDEIVHIQKNQHLAVHPAQDPIKDSCCNFEKSGQARFRQKPVVVVMPSAEMIRRADNEVNRNLIVSLREQPVVIGLNPGRSADVEIDGQFRAETSISILMDPASDISVNENFELENISFVHKKYFLNADTSIDAAFREENQPMPLLTLPDNAQYGKADEEIMGQSQVNEADRS